MKKINKKWKIALAAVGWCGLIGGSIATGLTYQNYNEYNKVADIYENYHKLNTNDTYKNATNFINQYNQSTVKSFYINLAISTVEMNVVNAIKLMANNTNLSSNDELTFENITKCMNQIYDDRSSLAYVNCDQSGLIAGSVVLSVFGAVGLWFSFDLLHTKLLKRKLEDQLNSYKEIKNNVDEWKKSL